MIQKTDSENTRIPGIPWIPWPQNDTFLVDTGGYCHRFLLRKGFIHSESMNRHNWCQQVFEEEPEALLFRVGLGGQDANLRVLPANNLVVKRQFRRPRCAPSSQASFPSFRNLSIELRESQVFRKHSKTCFYSATLEVIWAPDAPLAAGDDSPSPCGATPRFRDGVWKDQELRPGHFGGWYSIHFNTTSYHHTCPRNVGNDAPAALLENKSWALLICWVSLLEGSLPYHCHPLTINGSLNWTELALDLYLSICIRIIVTIWLFNIAMV